MEEKRHTENEDKTLPEGFRQLSPAELHAAKTGQEFHTASTDEYEQMKLRQRLPLAIAAGLAMAIVCAVLWALITAASHVQIGFMAIFVGIAVGYTVRAAGRAVQPSFGVLAAGLSLLSCLLGNFLSIFVYTAATEGIPFWPLLSEFDFAYTPQLMAETFSIMDILFYVLAIVEGFKLGFKRITIRNIPQQRG